MNNDYAFIPMSSFNSYFSQSNMEILFTWAVDNFNSFQIFIMNSASIYNLLAIGYSEANAKKKVKKHDNNLINKVITSLQNIGFSKHEAKDKILLLSDISNNDMYIKMHCKYCNLFNDNVVFRNICLDAATSVLLKKKINGNAVVAANYILAELPLLENIPSILNIESCVLVYKDFPIWWTKMYDEFIDICERQKIFIKCLT